MYETEANQRTSILGEIPPDVRARFGEVRKTILDRTGLPWGEHCTECVWPTCYTSCDLYSAREDGRCRRFVEGMVRVGCPEALNSYILKITFKRWGKLWSPGNIHLRSVKKALQLEKLDFQLGTLLYQMPLSAGIKRFLTWKMYGLKKRFAYRAEPMNDLPSSFMLECFNPNSVAVRLSLSIRSVDQKLQIPFQKLIQLVTGYNCVRIPYSKIADVVNLSKPFSIELIPNSDTELVTLFLGLMDFVREIQEPNELHRRPREGVLQKIKCVVWDLDNTLWDGTLIEDGVNKLTLKPGIKKVIEELDRRGILQSVASKNNYDEAVAVLKRMEIDEFILVPQISWLPKSNAIQEIAHQLNIGPDSMLFVDDSDFELGQVSAILPDVRILNANRYVEILDLDECSVPVTAESRERRRMYCVESQRRSVATSYGDDYVAFLKNCDIRLNIRPMVEDNLERVHELTQRTNQMNFSGNRYDRDVLKEILGTLYLDTYVLDVEDRFGTYGVVGFCIVDSRVPLMTDLMFSCRIQSKRVEHAFLAYLTRQYIERTGKDFQANYRKTDRNAPSGKVFADLGMEELEKECGVSRLIFRKENVMPDDGIIEVTTYSLSMVE
jgi:FkbH-like protein